MLSLSIGAFAFADDKDADAKKPKHSIKDVMAKALKGKLNKKVISGDATEKEKLELLDMYISLVVPNDPAANIRFFPLYITFSPLCMACVCYDKG